MKRGIKKEGRGKRGEPGREREEEDWEELGKRAGEGMGELAGDIAGEVGGETRGEMGETGGEAGGEVLGETPPTVWSSAPPSLKVEGGEAEGRGFFLVGFFLDIDFFLLGVGEQEEGREREAVGGFWGGLVEKVGEEELVAACWAMGGRKKKGKKEEGFVKLGLTNRRAIGEGLKITTNKNKEVKRTKATPQVWISQRLF